jgi:hypothetical protein
MATYETLKKDYQRYPGAMSERDYMTIRTDCGCTTCDCDALSQYSYHEGCHTFGLFDQEGDATNLTESGGLYDESKGSPVTKYKNSFLDEEMKYHLLVIKDEDE